MTTERQRALVIVAAAVVVIGALVVRAVYLGADPPHGLSASRAEYTDEGLKFYQARNRALFGQWHIDTPYAFQGHLSPSPVPTVLGWLAFEAFGVGRIQARVLSLASGVLSCLVLVLIGLRSGRAETGLLAGGFAAVNSILVSYDRLALFEPLALLFLLCAAFFYLEGGWRRFLVAPPLLVLAYFTRAGTIAIAAALLAAFLTEVWRGLSWRASRKAILFALGLAFSAGLLALVVRLTGDNQVIAQFRMRFATPYFDTYPLVPAAGDLAVRTFSDSAFSLWMPLPLLLALLSLAYSPFPPSAAKGRDPRLLFFWWFLASSATLALLDYRPTRYYVFMVPAALWLSADYLVSIARGGLELPLGSRRRLIWSALRILAGVHIAAVMLRYLVSVRHEFTLFADVDAVWLKSFQDFVESNFIGSRSGVFARTPDAVAAAAGAMSARVTNLLLLGMAILALSLLWIFVKSRIAPRGLPQRARLYPVVLVAFAVIASQTAVLRDCLSHHKRRYEVEYAERSIRALIGDNPRACIAGNWAPALCMGTGYLTLPFARGGGNAWDTFKRFPVTHFIIERGSPDEEAYLAARYPREFSRCRLLATFNVDFYTIGLYEYLRPEGAVSPPWPFREVDRK